MALLQFACFLLLTCPPALLPSCSRHQRKLVVSEYGLGGGCGGDYATVCPNAYEAVKMPYFGTMPIICEGGWKWGMVKSTLHKWHVWVMRTDACPTTAKHSCCVHCIPYAAAGLLAICAHASVMASQLASGPTPAYGLLDACLLCWVLKQQDKYCTVTLTC